MQSPVFTLENECQDCYKCVRHCHPKAIRIENGHAAVIPGACVACGECVRVCPARAKRIRRDVDRLPRLLESGRPVYASVAPSFVAAFPDWTLGRLAAALRSVGFAGVSETAHGAQLVSAATAEFLRDHPHGLWLSSACPASVDYVRKYHPALAPRIVPVDSPVLAHAKALRRAYGADAAVVFFGPCAAKKNEADRDPAALDLACTFPNLVEFLESRGVVEPPDEEAELALGPAQEGRLYSFEGGMNETLRDPAAPPARLLAVSGLAQIDRLCRASAPAEGAPVFVEMLACRGGCVSGPAMPPGGAAIDGIVRTGELAGEPRSSVGREVPVDVSHAFPAEAAEAEAPDETAIRQALATVGKYVPEDELNCGACGYETCRDFAAALLAGKAETSMCHTFLRKSFERKSSALVKYIPAGVVVVDSSLSIVESNHLFCEIMGGEALRIFETLGSLDGLDLDAIGFPFAPLLSSILENGGETTRFNQTLGDRVANVSVFCIARGRLAGAVVQDVTKGELQRETVARSARELIRKNVRVVQEVARLFGEHVAQSEILLNQIAGRFSAYGSDNPAPESEQEAVAAAAAARIAAAAAAGEPKK